MTCEATILGVLPDDLEVDLYARGGNVSAGYVYPLLLFQGLYSVTNHIALDGETKSFFPGGPGSCWAGVKGGTGAVSIDLLGAHFAVALEDVLDTQKGRFKVRGIVKAFTARGSGSIALGEALTILAGSSPSSLLTATPASVAGTSSGKYLGYALESGTSTASKITVLFDGWNGFGAPNSG